MRLFMFHFDFVVIEALTDTVGMVLPYEISGWGENFWAFSGETRCLKPSLELLELLKKKKKSELSHEVK